MTAANGSAILRKAWQGKRALVTGASAGIGVALAGELAAAGVNLVLTARRRERLDALAAKLTAAHHVEAHVLVADLEDAGASAWIYDATEGAGLTIDVLINNAGFGEYREFYTSTPERQTAMVDVNCRAVVAMTRLFLPKMVERHRGDVMIVASTASFQPVAYLATYAATKAFDRFLAEALAEEVNRYGVRVSALCPGPTESEFSDVAGSRKRGKGYQRADEVARAGLEGLVNGKTVVIPYAMGRLQTWMQRFLPRRAVAGMAERMFRPDHLKH